MVGGASLILKDVPAYVMASGNPAHNDMITNMNVSSNTNIICENIMITNNTVMCNMRTVWLVEHL
jgi:serine acetyltransferase